MGQASHFYFDCAVRFHKHPDKSSFLSVSVSHSLGGENARSSLLLAFPACKKWAYVRSDAMALHSYEGLTKTNEKPRYVWDTPPRIIRDKKWPFTSCPIIIPSSTLPSVAVCCCSWEELLWHSSGHVLLMFSPSVKVSAQFSRDKNSHMETGAIIRDYILILILEPTYMENSIHSLAMVRVLNCFSCGGWWPQTLLNCST